MTSCKKVAPAPGSSLGPSDLTRDNRRSTKGIKQVALKHFDSTISQNGQGGSGFRTEAHLEDSPGLPNDYLEEIAEIKRLSRTPEFLAANAKVRRPPCPQAHVACTDPLQSR